MHGFPGESVVIDHQVFIVIDPSEPGELATYRGFPDL